MKVNTANTYNLFFHPFKHGEVSKKGFGRLAASIAIFIGTLGIYHLIIGCKYKYRAKHPSDGADLTGVFRQSLQRNPSSGTLEEPKSVSEEERSGDASSDSDNPSVLESFHALFEDIAAFESNSGSEIERNASFKTLLDKFENFMTVLDDPDQERVVLQKLEVLNPSDGFNMRLAGFLKVRDFELIGSDGKKVRVHLDLLDQKTGYFSARKSMGGTDFEKRESESIYSGETLKLMVNFLYNGSLPSNLSESQLEALSEAELFYNIPDLKLKIDFLQFLKKHPQVIRPSQWQEWAKEANVELQTITDEEAFKALPKNIEQILNRPCHIFKSGETVEQARMHAYIPEGLTFEDLGKILETKFPNNGRGFRWFGYQHVAEGSKRLFQDLSTEGGWIEMTKRVIPGSRGKPLASLQQMVQDLCNEEEHYEFPKALEAIACCLAWYFNTQERLFPKAEEDDGTDKDFFQFAYTRCQEEILGNQVVVGFSHIPSEKDLRDGIHVNNTRFIDSYSLSLAVAVRRKLC